MITASCLAAPESTPILFPPLVAILIFDVQTDSSSQGFALIKFIPLFQLQSSNLAINLG